MFRIKITDDLFLQLLTEEEIRRAYKDRKIDFKDLASAFQGKSFVLVKKSEGMHYEDFKKELKFSTMNDLYKFIAKQSLNTDPIIQKYYDQIMAQTRALLNSKQEDKLMNEILMQSMIIDEIAQYASKSRQKGIKLGLLARKILGEDKRNSVQLNKNELKIETKGDQDADVYVFVKSMNELLDRNLIMAVPSIIVQIEKISEDYRLVKNNRDLLQFNSKGNEIDIKNLTLGSDIFFIIPSRVSTTLELTIIDDDTKYEEPSYIDIVKMVLHDHILNKGRLTPSEKRLVGYYHGYQFKDELVNAIKQIGSGFKNAFISDRNAFIASHILYNLSYNYKNIDKEANILNDYKARFAEWFNELLSQMLPQSLIDIRGLTNYILNTQVEHEKAIDRFFSNAPTNIEALILNFIDNLHKIIKRNSDLLSTDARKQDILDTSENILRSNETINLITDSAEKMANDYKNLIKDDRFNKIIDRRMSEDEIYHSIKTILQARLNVNDLDIIFGICPVTLGIVNYNDNYNYYSNIIIDNKKVRVYFSDNESKTTFDGDERYQTIVKIWVASLQKESKLGDIKELVKKLGKYVPQIINDVIQILTIKPSLMEGKLDEDTIKKYKNILYNMDVNVFESLFTKLAAYYCSHMIDTESVVKNTIIDNPIIIASDNGDMGFTSKNWFIKEINGEEQYVVALSGWNELIESQRATQNVYITLDSIKEAIANNQLLSLDNNADDLLLKWKKSCVIGKGLTSVGIYNKDINHYFSPIDLFKFIGTKALKVKITVVTKAGNELEIGNIIDPRQLNGITSDGQYIMILLPHMENVESGDENAMWEAIYREGVLTTIGHEKLAEFEKEHLEDVVARATAERKFLAEYLFKDLFINREIIPKRFRNSIAEIIDENRQKLEEFGKELIFRCAQEGIFKDAYDDNKDAYQMIEKILNSMEQKLDISYNQLQNKDIAISQIACTFSNLYPQLVNDIKETIKTDTKCLNLDKYNLSLTTSQKLSPEIDKTLCWLEDDPIKKKLQQIPNDKLLDSILYTNIDKILSYLTFKKTETINGVQKVHRLTSSEIGNQRFSIGLKNDVFMLEKSILNKFISGYKNIIPTKTEIDKNKEKILDIIIKYIKTLISKNNNINNNLIESAIENSGILDDNYIVYNDDILIIPKIIVTNSSETENDKTKRAGKIPPNIKKTIENYFAKYLNKEKINKSEEKAITQITKKYPAESIRNVLSGQDKSIVDSFIDKFYYSLPEQQLKISYDNKKYVSIYHKNNISVRELDKNIVVSMQNGIKISDLYEYFYKFLEYILTNRVNTYSLESIIDRFRIYNANFRKHLLRGQNNITPDIKSLCDKMNQDINDLQFQLYLDNSLVNCDTVIEKEDYNRLKIQENKNSSSNIVKPFEISFWNSSNIEEILSDNIDKLSNVEIEEKSEPEQYNLEDDDKFNEQIMSYPSIRTLANFVVEFNPEKLEFKPDSNMYKSYKEVINDLRASTLNAKNKYEELFSKFAEKIPGKTDEEKKETVYNYYIDVMENTPRSFRQEHIWTDIYHRKIGIYPQVIIDNMFRFYYYTALARVGLSTLGRRPK